MLIRIIHRSEYDTSATNGFVFIEFGLALGRRILATFSGISRRSGRIPGTQGYVWEVFIFRQTGKKAGGGLARRRGKKKQDLSCVPTGYPRASARGALRL